MYRAGRPVVVRLPGAVTITHTSSTSTSSTADLRSPVVFGYALLFLVVFAPTVYSSIKALLLILALMALGLRFARTERLGVHPAVLCRTVLFSATGLFFVLVGSLRGNPGAMKMAPVFVAWPIVFTLLIGGINDRLRLARIVQVLVAATIAIEVYTYSFLFSEAGVLPGPLFIPLPLDLSVNGNFTEYNSLSITSLLFLVPFLIGAMILWPRTLDAPVRRRSLLLALILGMPLVLLSGRRGLWVAVGLAPITALVFRTWLRGSGPGLIPWRRSLLKAGLVGLVSLVAVQATTGVGTGWIWKWFQQGFDFSAGDAGLGRNLQFHALIRGWTESPLIGKGLGAVSEVVRAQDQPWAYELVYIAMLFTTGIVGVAIYAYGGVWILRQAKRMTRDGYENSPVLLSLLVGTIGIVVANATNPYLTKFDGMWNLFLPIAFINHWLLTRDRC